MTHDSRLKRLEQRALFFAGGILLSSGVIHTLVWAVDGGSLSGDVSWRKPILFGFSAGATVISLGWVVGKLKPRFGDSILLTAFAVAMTVEVGLITLQQWRGVASHFNRSTSFNATLLAWIEGLILFATIVIADLTYRSFRKMSVPPDTSLAIRAGMLLLLLACLLGFLLVGYGNHQASIAQDPGTYGNAGVMKFPHGMPIHAIQFFPILAWCLRKLGVNETLRIVAVKYAFLAVVALTAFALIQTFTGRARFDIGWLSGGVLVASVGLLTVPLWIGLRAIVHIQTGSASVPR